MYSIRMCKNLYFYENVSLHEQQVITSYFIRYFTNVTPLSIQFHVEKMNGRWYIDISSHSTTHYISFNDFYYHIIKKCNRRLECDINKNILRVVNV